MERLYVMLLLVVMGFSCLASGGTSGKKKGKKAKMEQRGDAVHKEELNKYEAFLKEPGRETAKGDFMTLHKIGEKIYFEYPLKHIGREVLLGGTVSASSDPMFINVGYKYINPLHLKIGLQDSSILFNIPNVAATLGCDEPWAKKVLERNYMSDSYKRYPIMAYNNDSTAVVFEVTDLLYNNPKVTPEGGIDIFSFTPIKEEKAFEKPFFGKIKAFDNNISVEINQRMQAVLMFFVASEAIGEVSCRITISMLLLPENKMKARIQDSRVGVFPTGNDKYRNISMPKYEISQQEDGLRAYRLANRWRLEPKDMDTWKRGELVEPVTPIVWYVDDAFPEEWKAPIKAGVLVWNKAFEKIGFKNAIQVRDFPVGDMTFDSDNLKYSCLRYAPTAVANAMGPSWVDPTTGEIINASVIVYNDIVKLINHWRFIQTAQVDPRVRGKKMPKEIFDESMTYVIAHEIGHTLGLMHNMAASSAYPVDSLRSVSFTQKYGTTSSIMDYARYNYVAQPEDQGVKLTPPDLGVYDEYVIQWLYSPIPDAKDMWEEAKMAERWIDEKAGDPRYRFGRQQLLFRCDPSALEEDLGDDPIKAGSYGIKNLKYILENLNQWITDDQDLRHRKGLYADIYGQYFRYLFNVAHQLGGIQLTQVKDGTAGTPVKPVDRETQKRSLAWLIKEIRECSWINAPEVTCKFDLNTKMSSFISWILGGFFVDDFPNNVILSSHLSNEEKGYTLREYFDDLYTGVFAPILQGKKLTEEDKIMQRFMIQRVSYRLQDFSQKGITVSATGVEQPSLEEISTLPSLEEIRAYGLGDVRMNEFVYKKLKDVESRYGKRAAAYTLLNNRLGESEFPLQGEIVTICINDTESNLLVMLKKVDTLVKSKIATVHRDDKAHYEWILLKLGRVLNK